MPSALAERSCIPCRGGIPPLTPEEAANYRGQAPDWDLLDGAKRIERTFRSKNFREAFAFVERAAALGRSRRTPSRDKIWLGLHHGFAADQENQRSARE
jgi:4a-hydroxytetrahydrobiopterin dehydratase